MTAGAPQHLVVDSCAYLRLATHVHPHFWGGHPDYELWAIAETNPELSGKRLLSKFVWLNRDPHPSNRAKRQLKMSKADAKAIEESKEHVLDHAEAILQEVIPHARVDRDGNPLPHLSPADLSVLCTALHFNYGVLTDEFALSKVARTLGLPVMSSLKMLRYFLSIQVVDDAKVDVIIQRWHEAEDLPNSQWAKEFRSIFKRSPPKLV